LVEVLLELLKLVLLGVCSFCIWTVTLDPGRAVDRLLPPMLSLCRLVVLGLLEVETGGCLMALKGFRIVGLDQRALLLVVLGKELKLPLKLLSSIIV